MPQLATHERTAHLQREVLAQCAGAFTFEQLFLEAPRED
jgi:hypothetical protein